MIETEKPPNETFQLCGVTLVPWILTPVLSILGLPVNEEESDDITISPLGGPDAPIYRNRN